MAITFRQRPSALPAQIRELSRRFRATSHERLPLSLAEILAESTRDVLASGGAGFGWAGLNPVTEAIRRRRGYGGKPPLERRGDLKQSVEATQVDGNSARVTVSAPWATVLHLGGPSQDLKGQAVSLPARPFLVLTDGAKSDMYAALAEHFLERL